LRRREFLTLLPATVIAATASANPRASQNIIGAPLAAGNQPQTGVVRFAAIGDMGTGESDQYSVGKGMAAYHAQHPFDTVLTLGDNIYPNGEAALFKERFERPYADLLQRGVRFYASLGNHDVRRGLQAQIKYANFNMGGQPYYSFVKGDGLIEFFALDSTNMTRQQLQWLDEALAASKAPWKVAYFHHPLYSSGITHGSETKLRAQIEPLLVKHGVTAVLSGHDHVYERTKPQRGVQYFVSGAGGKLRQGDIDRRTSFFAAGNDQVNSFMYFEAAPEKLSFWAVDPAGNTLDNGALTRARSATPGK
jgi:3',5'-cyclic AMP phosphodiesterase CpdA